MIGVSEQFLLVVLIFDSSLYYTTRVVGFIYQTLHKQTTCPINFLFVWHGRLFIPQFACRLKNKINTWGAVSCQAGVGTESSSVFAYSRAVLSGYILFFNFMTHSQMLWFVKFGRKLVCAMIWPFLHSYSCCFFGRLYSEMNGKGNACYSLNYAF